MRPAMRRLLSPELLETARAFSAGDRVPVTPRDAATVLLLRDSDAGPEVFMMVRQRSMAFAPGVVVFPGGGVDERDRIGESPVGLAARLGCSDEEAGAVLRAAVRELEEEAGVVVAISDLGLWDAWTTPEFEPRRYRTWFFTARMPEGQTAQELSTESSSVAWVRPSVALEKAAAGEWSLMPPTYLSCLRLATFDSVDAVMAATRQAAVEMFTPTLDGETLTSPAWAAALLEAR